MSEYGVPMVEVADLIVESGAESLDLCYQCGTCSATCPWNLVRDFRIRRVIGLAQLGLEGYEDHDLWVCATCNACVDACPRGVEIVDVVRAARAIIAETGAYPKTLRGAIGSVQSNGNPWMGDADRRMAWAEGLGAPAFGPEHEYAYFTCCSQAFDARNTRVARATLEALTAAGVSFGLLDGSERCCGDAVRKCGAEASFEGLSAHNLRAFREAGVEKLLVPSPHCMNTFTKEYGVGRPATVRHVLQVLHEQLEAGALRLRSPVEARVVYHDPCYLGRQNEVYDGPRALLRAVPGLQLLEFARARQDAVCCGGGGGQLWMETPVEERLAVLKVREALVMGAEVIATACPYCVSMFEDARTALGRDDVRVVDVTEIIAQAL
jgi:Fe-S oxidoreductase